MDSRHGKPLIPIGIVAGTITMMVHRPIHLDRQPNGIAVEIEDIAPCWMLATEVKAIGAPGPEDPPQKTFRKGRFPPQAFGD